MADRMQSYQMNPQNMMPNFISQQQMQQQPQQQQQQQQQQDSQMVSGLPNPERLWTPLQNNYRGQPNVDVNGQMNQQASFSYKFYKVACSPSSTSLFSHRTSTYVTDCRFGHFSPLVDTRNGHVLPESSQMDAWFRLSLNDLC